MSKHKNMSISVESILGIWGGEWGVGYGDMSEEKEKTSDETGLQSMIGTHE